MLPRPPPYLLLVLLASCCLAIASVHAFVITPLSGAFRSSLPQQRWFPSTSSTGATASGGLPPSTTTSLKMSSVPEGPGGAKGKSKRRRRKGGAPSSSSSTSSSGPPAAAKYDASLEDLIVDERKSALPRLEDLKVLKSGGKVSADKGSTGATPGILLPRELEEMKQREKAKEATKGAPPYFDTLTKLTWSAIAFLIITEVVVQIIPKGNIATGGSG